MFYRRIDSLVLEFFSRESTVQEALAQERYLVLQQTHRFWQPFSTTIVPCEHSSAIDFAVMSFHTPQHACQLNPFVCEPLTPQNPRVVKALSRKVLGKIQNMSLLVPTSNAITISPRGGRSSEFKEALKRMRDGSGLQRLKQQRDFENVTSHDEEMQRVRGLSTNEPADKGLSNPTVQLGRQVPEQRMSGYARSA
jgi:hypothetical protein